MLRPDRSVVQPGRNRMGQVDLPVIILKEVGHGTLQDSRLSSGETRGVFTASDSQAAGLDTDHLDLHIPDERMEEAHRIAATPDASDEAIRHPTFCRQDLSPSLSSDDRLKVTDHPRIGMGSE